MDGAVFEGESTRELVDVAGRRVSAPRFPRLARRSPVQRLFLRRLQRLALLDRYSETHLTFSPSEIVLLRRAVYSVFRDCLELGVLEDARAILRAAALTDHTPG